MLRRSHAMDELNCYLCYGPAAMTADQLVWLVGLRWPIKQCFRDGKQLFSLDNYKDRGW